MFLKQLDNARDVIKQRGLWACQTEAMCIEAGQILTRGPAAYHDMINLC